MEEVCAWSDKIFFIEGHLKSGCFLSVNLISDYFILSYFISDLFISDYFILIYFISGLFMSNYFILSYFISDLFISAYFILSYFISGLCISGLFISAYFIWSYFLSGLFISGYLQSGYFRIGYLPNWSIYQMELWIWPLMKIRFRKRQAVFARMIQSGIFNSEVTCASVRKSFISALSIFAVAWDRVVPPQTGDDAPLCAGVACLLRHALGTALWVHDDLETHLCEEMSHALQGLLPVLGFVYSLVRNNVEK